MESTYIAKIERAIENAHKEQSKLAPEVLALDGMSSPKVRHLYNNLGAISSKYFEVGVWQGSSFVSVCYDNTHLKAIACDNWSEFNPDGTIVNKFFSNLERLIKSLAGRIEVNVSDCWSISTLPFKPDMYTYDGEHSEEGHEKAVAHFFPMMADRFLYLCDDFGEEGEGFYHVQTATRRALALVSDKYEVEKEWVLSKKEGFWEGFFVALIRRK